MDSVPAIEDQLLALQPICSAQRVSTGIICGAPAVAVAEIHAIELELATSVLDHSRQDEDFSAHTAPYRVVPLHGHVPKSGSNGSQDIILSETDYMRSQPLSSKILKTIMNWSSRP